MSLVTVYYCYSSTVCWRCSVFVSKIDFVSHCILCLLLHLSFTWISRVPNQINSWLVSGIRLCVTIIILIIWRFKKQSRFKIRFLVLFPKLFRKKNSFHHLLLFNGCTGSVVYFDFLVVLKVAYRILIKRIFAETVDENRIRSFEVGRFTF